MYQNSCRFTYKLLLSTLVVAFLLGVVSCGGGGGSSSSSSLSGNGAPNGTPAPSTVDHVVLVVMENQNFSDIVGNAAMPYLNGLIPRGGLAANYFANTHPSIGNYFMMTTGQVITNDDAFSGIVSGDNMARDLGSAGKSWRLYAESLPSVGYLGPDVYPYVRHHAPFTFFSDVQNSPAQQQNIVPLTQLASDTTAGALPTFAMLVPDQKHNTHDCPLGTAVCTLNNRLSTADQWLLANVDPLLSAPKTLVVVVFDESSNDNTNGGGQVLALFLGSGVKPGFRSTTFFQHQSLYRLILERSGVTALPPDAASAPSMNEFLQ